MDAVETDDQQELSNKHKINRCPMVFVGNVKISVCMQCCYGCKIECYMEGYLKKDMPWRFSA